MSGKLAGKTVQDVLRDLSHPQALRRTLALATLNALAETLLQRDGLPPTKHSAQATASTQCVFRPMTK